ncbi:MAG: hypothetical protein HQL25_07360, partial [Candidatus Omnitrophica bacterium]|nr:hypothetical protein [Candidatus Omnitrophota bacterium]
MKYKKFLSLFLGLILIGLSCFIFLKAAQQKPFWNDEGYDILSIYSTNIQDIISGNTGQPNNNPLYSIFQKINFS